MVRPCTVKIPSSRVTPGCPSPSRPGPEQGAAGALQAGSEVWLAGEATF